MFANPDFRTAFPLTDTDTREAAWSDARIRKSLDAQMAALLRAHLRDDLDQATSWQDLSQRLRAKGFGLRTDGIAVRLHDLHSLVDICSTTFLGWTAQELDRRFAQARH